MATTYDPKITALLCIDFYNDFLSEGGKLWPWVEKMATQNHLLNNLRILVKAARQTGIAIYHVPHHRWEPGDYVRWKYPNSLPARGRRAASLREGYVGRRISPRFPGPAGRLRLHGALGFERLSKHGPGTSTEAIRQGEAHLRGLARQHMLGGDSADRDGTRLPHNFGPRWHRGSIPGSVPCCPQYRRADLCARNHHHGRVGRGHRVFRGRFSAISTQASRTSGVASWAF